jgi:uncharacterized alpha-E superfamily protein
VSEANESLHRITGTPIDSFRFRSEQLMGLLESELNFSSVEDILRNGLHEYLDNLQQKMNNVDTQVRSDFMNAVYQQQQQQRQSA